MFITFINPTDGHRITASIHGDYGLVHDLQHYAPTMRFPVHHSYATADMFRSEVTRRLAAGQLYEAGYEDQCAHARAEVAGADLLAMALIDDDAADACGRCPSTETVWTTVL